MGYKRESLASTAQLEKIARRYCENQGLSPNSTTSGTGLMGNAMTQPLWRFVAPQVLKHLQMVEAVRYILEPEGPVVSGPEELSSADKDSIREAVLSTIDSGGRDNAFLEETLRHRAERSEAPNLLSVVEEVDQLMHLTPAGVAAYFFPTPAARVVDPIRRTYAQVVVPREQLLLEEVLRRMLA